MTRKRHRAGFADSPGEVYYDLLFDNELIEASFATQYGIRLSVEEISAAEFLRLLRCLMPETPLGRVVAIRAENDSSRLNKMGRAEKEIRARWRWFQSAKRKPSNRHGSGELKDLQKMLKSMFS